MALTVTIASTDRTKYVDTATINIVDQLNDQPNTANFACFGFTPAVGNTVTIADGTETAFAGYILSVSRLYRKASDRAVYRVVAIDASYKADAALATGYWSSLTTAFANIWDGTEGNAAPASAIFNAGLEDRMACAQRIAQQYGGWWDVTRTATTITSSTVLLYANGAYAGTGPSVTTATTHWWELDYTTDARQVSDRVYATWTPITLLSFETVNNTAPVSSADYTAIGAGGGVTCLLNDADLITLQQSQAATGNNPTNPTVATAAAVGATSITVNAMVAWGSTNWWLVNGQYIYGTGSGTSISNIPASGSGSIVAAIPVGAVLEPQYSAVLSSFNNDPITPARCVPYTYNEVGGGGTHYKRIGQFLTATEAGNAATNEVTKWASAEVRGSYMTTSAVGYAGYSTDVVVGDINGTYLINRSTITWDLGRQKFVKKVEFATQRRDLVNILLSR